jgi:hypothetical protein
MGYAQMPLSEKGAESDMDVPRRMIKKTCDQKRPAIEKDLRSKLNRTTSHGANPL